MREREGESFFSAGETTNVKSGVGPHGGCWEITGCSTRPNAAVGTGYGCKALPKNGCGNACVCNGAWQVYANGTILSVRKKRISFCAVL
jgi:hypothetical protein